MPSHILLSFFGTPDVAHQTALWLKESLDKPNRFHLMGNHDLSYFNQEFVNSGFSYEKYNAIKNTGIDLSKLLNYFWIDDWLCTHAGLSKNFYMKYSNGLPVKEFLQKYDTPNLRKFFYNCSNFRGGIDPFGGIVWCDYDEFEDIPNVKQIFGHTRSQIVRWKKNEEKNTEHICLDTELHNYAIYEKKKMVIKSIEWDKLKLY